MSVNIRDIPSLNGIINTTPPSRPALERQPKYVSSSTPRSEITHSSRGLLSLLPEQLHRILTESYDRDKHVEYTTVKSAWYGKQTTSVRHEFILIQVEDLAVPGLENYLLLDRTIGDPSRAHLERTTSLFTLCLGTDALDAFWISRDGNEEQLLRDCHLDSHRYLERIDFQSERPLFLHQLAILAHHVSNRHPQYHPAVANCYWFTGLIWECLRHMRPGAGYTDYAARNRGRFGFIRLTPNPFQVREVVKAVQEEIWDLSQLFEHQHVSVLESLGRANLTTDAPFTNADEKSGSM